MEKPAKSREESIRQLQVAISSLEGRIIANGKELEGAGEKLKETRRQLELTEPRQREIREERQGLLADGKETKEATRALREECEKQELLTEQIAGLERKLFILESEAERLPEQKRQYEMELWGLTLKPLISKYNEYAEKMAKIMEEFYSIVWKLDHPTNFVFPSSSGWDGSLALIPRLYFTPEAVPTKRGENFFSTSEFKDRYASQVKQGPK